LLKNLKFILLALAILLILVIVRNSDRNIFRKYVKTTVDVLQNNDHTISPEQVRALKSPWLVINIDSNDIPDSLTFENSIRIPIANILDEVNRKILTEVKGDLILYSNDAGTAARAWIILNQLGFKNVKILATQEFQEVLKYKFQPDTAARLELDTI